MSDNRFLLQFCCGVYLHHEKYGEAALDAKQIAQMNLYFKSDTGNYDLSFLVPETMVIYNDENIIEYVQHINPDKCLIKVKKQVVSILDKFNQVDLNGRAILLHEFGTCRSRANPPRHRSYGKSQIPTYEMKYTITLLY